MSDSPAPLDVREPEMTVVAVINEMDRLIDRMTSLEMTGDEKMTGDGRGESASPPPLEFREPEKVQKCLESKNRQIKKKLKFQTIDTTIDEPNNAPMAGREMSAFIQKENMKCYEKTVLKASLKREQELPCFFLDVLRFEQQILIEKVFCMLTLSEFDQLNILAEGQTSGG
ncbi:hypothetical protein CAEBREN_22922 [Caenorhabditis brenneri]|uniref:Uncharacterized protein n=1 Tax=Caenorhabditis brenneri TaxID=135651 RepID=G0N1P4_CAEBE|nr:hypothetical protein CAEBREN_22922 [Caenorhabditis brenneri]